jgi:hypothetical protein
MGDKAGQRPIRFQLRVPNLENLRGYGLVRRVVLGQPTVRTARIAIGRMPIRDAVKR